MHPNTASLASIRIASPCSADWDQMVGDEKSRFCAQCRLNVHNLSAMTTDEAEALLRAGGSGRLCVRFYRRADGTVLTQDCPKGLKQKLRRMWLRAAAMVAALWTGVGCARSDSAAGDPQPTGMVPTRIKDPAPGSEQPVRMGEAEMGDSTAPPKPLVPQPLMGSPGPAGPTPATATPASTAPGSAVESPEMGKVSPARRNPPK